MGSREMENNENSKVASKDVPHNKRTPLGDVVPLPQPYVLYIDPCGACNLTCTFCPCNTVKENQAERHKMMSFELFQKIVEDLKGFPEKVKVVCLFCYGEPLINPRILI